MNNIVVRGLSGAVFVILVVGSLWLNAYTSLAVLALFTCLGLYEFFQLFRNSNQVQVSVLFSTGVHFFIFLLVAASLFNWIPSYSVFLALPILFLSMLVELWRKEENPLLNLGIHFLGLIYVVIPFLVILALQLKTANQHLVIYMLILIWSNDTFAYLSGRMLGKTKLFERISPNKTWEGTIGGVIMTVVVGGIVAFTTNQDYFFWLISALIVAPSAIFGDLLESLFKRSLNIKDTGNIMPGHGGILDRFDAALFTAPIFCCWWLFYQFI
ncbi:MAG: CDP-archaeol synthase [Crocinitomicaceae bacterium]|nr:MAG: CDP-archaeol synthase [Crocinitomicaceae bacterium]